MNHWKRIFIAVVILIGGTCIFALWALNEFDATFERLAYQAPTQNLASASNVTVEVSDVDQAGTSTMVFEDITGSPIESATASSTTVVSSEPVFDIATFSITSPRKGDTIHKGCGYALSWTEPNTISSADIWIVNADTIEKVKPTESNLIIFATSSPLSRFDWWVGNVQSSRYYIFVSKANGTDITYRSDPFFVTDKPSGVDCPAL